MQIRLETLKAHVDKLRAGHDTIARKPTLRAQTFVLLPRELRDAVFEQFRIFDKPLEVSWSRNGDGYILEMPKDEALYFSKLHVGEQIAGEVAEIFYNRNIFSFCAGLRTERGRTLRYGREWSEEKLEAWLNTDHYGAGFLPRDNVRNVSLHFNGSLQLGFNRLTWDETVYETEVMDHLTFEPRAPRLHLSCLATDRRCSIC